LTRIDTPLEHRRYVSNGVNRLTLIKKTDSHEGTKARKIAIEGTESTEEISVSLAFSSEFAIIPFRVVNSRE